MEIIPKPPCWVLKTWAPRLTMKAPSQTVAADPGKGANQGNVPNPEVAEALVAAGLDPTRSDWTKASWSKASWSKASWSKASWSKASWSGADWAKATWTCAECGKPCYSRYRRCHVCRTGRPIAQPEQWRSSWQVDAFGNRSRQISCEAPAAEDAR